MEGTTFGHYELLELLGRGGMGEVYRARDTKTDRIVALKLLPPQLAEDEVFQRRFRREAQAASGVNDPHVVPIHGYGEIDGRLYLDMRLIEGLNLGTILAQRNHHSGPGSLRWWSSRWPRRWTRRTPTASSTGTSSPPTS